MRHFFFASFATVYLCWSALAIMEISDGTIPTRSPTPTIIGDMPQVPLTPIPTQTRPLVTVEWGPTSTATTTPTPTGTRFVLRLTPVDTMTPTATPTRWPVWLPFISGH